MGKGEGRTTEIKKNEEWWERNRKAVEDLATVERAWEGKLLSADRAREESEQQLDEILALPEQTLLSIFPEVLVSSKPTYSEGLQELKEPTLGLLKQQRARIRLFDSALRTQHTKEAQSILQAQCEQY